MQFLLVTELTVIRRRYQLIFLLVLIVSGSLTVYVTRAPIVGFVGRPVTANHLSFGSSGTGNTGWLMPSNTVFMTSYATNQTVSGFLVGTLNVFNFGIQPGTVLQLGLYFNGHMVANRTYYLGNIYQNHAGGRAGQGWLPASMIGKVGMQGRANFTLNMLGPNVAVSGMTAPLPVATVVTVTAWTNLPIWVQVDLTASTHSYEKLDVTDSTPTPEITAVSRDTIAPFTLSVGLESQ